MAYSSCVVLPITPAPPPPHPSPSPTVPCQPRSFLSVHHRRLLAPTLTLPRLAASLAFGCLPLDQSIRVPTPDCQGLPSLAPIATFRR
ncbi:hypothetical protein SETIT_5G308000v2 [Setaria italica]|uniref:Uncharacterized protein n=1 Tax=Setaria italica TaxID=4555 RepID=A0A368RAM2_SETIT|nr:hypothetical protein SETIT_5G308000v2 [Setaria italica]